MEVCRRGLRSGLHHDVESGTKLTFIAAGGNTAPSSGQGALDGSRMVLRFSSSVVYALDLVGTTAATGQSLDPTGGTCIALLATSIFTGRIR